MVDSFVVLTAMRGVQEDYVIEAMNFLGYLGMKTSNGGHDQSSFNMRHRRVISRGSAILIAAIIVLSLSVVAFAAFTNWFDTFFSTQSETELSQGQLQFIEDKSVGIGQRVTVNGYTVTVDSALCDTQNLYLVIRIEGPTGAVIDLDPSEGCLAFDSVNSESLGTYERTGHLMNCNTTWYHLVDGDGKENTATLLMRNQRVMSADSNQVYTDDEVWRFRFSNLFTRTGDYFENKTILAEGEWIFEFSLTEMSDNLEMISSPVACVALSGGEGKAKEPIEVMVTSFVIHPLGATCEFSFIPGSEAESAEILDVYLIMKDGSTIMLHPKSGHVKRFPDPIGGNMSYVFDAPVMLNEIDYLVLPDNVMVPNPDK